MVNEAFVRRFFKGEDPLGKHFGRSELAAARQYEIVGIVQDARYLPYDLDQPVGPFMFLSASQHDVFPTRRFTDGDVRNHFLHDVVVAMRPGAVLTDDEARRALAAVDPNLPVVFIRTLEEQVAGQFNQQRLIARLTSFYGLLSLILASIGLYGVTAYNAGRRINEIGVRMALGANRGQVIGLVLRGAFGLIAIGLIAGLPLAIAAGSFLGNQLYGMNPYNPEVIAVAVAALALASLLASAIPARRASLTSPSEALRAE